MEQLTWLYAILCLALPVVLVVLAGVFVLTASMLSSHISREEDELPPDAIR